MTSSGLRKRLTSPIAGFTLLAFSTVALPLPSLAQVPTFEPTAPTRVNAQTAESAYTLGAGDRLKLDIFDVPEYSGEFQVLVDGTLNLPVIGSVSVEGQTIRAATDIISSRYARYVKRPLVTLSLLSPRPITLAVAGEVSRPGTYSVPIAQGSQYPTVTQALTLAGGVTQSAEVGEVQIRRRRPSGGGGEQVINVNLWDLYRAGNLSQDITLRDGDSIFVPTVTTINPVDTRQLADASFAANTTQPINIAVVGEVGRPGPYAVTGGGSGTGGATGAITGRETGPTSGGSTGGAPTVTKAIQVAGGITSRADIRSITIRRSTRSGEERVINVNLWDLLNSGDLSEDVILQEGDTITVPTATALTPQEATELASASFSPNTIVVNVVGEVTKPGAIPVPPNTPLNQAILAAGGFDNRRARKSRVDLVRLNPDGTVTKRQIEVDLAQGINEETNPTLRNNDVVVVNRSNLASFTDTLGSILSPVGGIFSLFNFFRIFR
ncbi:MAG TPA: SLBB domain-containing protein [Cyanophyceae cyanobacterium]